MNLRLAGGVMIGLATISGVAGLFAGPLADSTAGISEQAGWATGCFYRDISACMSSREHDVFVGKWKDRGIQIAIGSGFLVILGVTLIAASIGRKTQPTADDAEPADLTEEEELELNRIEREASIRGGRLV